jgi:hypothetical protein
MICWMLHPADNTRWEKFDSIKAAKEQFWIAADDAINRWGQSEHLWREAWVCLGKEDPIGSGDAYPDRIFRYNPDRDTVSEEQT